MPTRIHWIAASGLLLATFAARGPVAAQEPTNAYTTSIDGVAGGRLFDRHCSRCHGIGGTGGEGGPDLSRGFRRASTDAGLFAVIREGIPDTEMRGIARDQSDQAVWQVVSFLRWLTRGMSVSGDTAAGAAVYARAGCASCHVMAGVGGLDGPDLSDVGSWRSPDELRSDLVDPDESVQPDWWTMRVTHNDGTRVEGRRMGEGTYSVRILDADGRMWSLRKSELTAYERIETSPMPSYGDTLTESELQDLVAYLHGLTRTQ